MTTVLISVAVLVVVIVGIVLGRQARKKQEEDLARNDCILCGSDKTTEAADGSWRCTKCGYESTWENRPELRAKVRHLQDLNRACACYDRAAERLTPFVGTGGALLGVAGMGERQQAMEDAGQAMDEGLRLLQDLARTVPDLFQSAPDAAHSSGGTMLLDLAGAHAFAGLLSGGQAQRTLNEINTFSGRLLEVLRKAQDDLRRAAAAQAT